MNKIILFLSAIMIMSSCALPELITPQFEKDKDTVLKEIQDVADFENVEVEFTSTAFKDEKSSILILLLTNGNEKTKDISNMYEIGKDALKILINSISNEEEYNDFKVVFIRSEIVNNVKKNYKEPFDFTLEQLR